MWAFLSFILKFSNKIHNFFFNFNRIRGFFTPKKYLFTLKLNCRNKKIPNFLPNRMQSNYIYHFLICKNVEVSRDFACQLESEHLLGWYDMKWSNTLILNESDLDTYFLKCETSLYLNSLMKRSRKVILKLCCAQNKKKIVNIYLQWKSKQFCEAVKPICKTEAHTHIHLIFT